MLQPSRSSSTRSCARTRVSQTSLVSTRTGTHGQQRVHKCVCETGNTLIVHMLGRVLSMGNLSSGGGWVRVFVENEASHARFVLRCKLNIMDNQGVSDFTLPWREERA